MRITIRVSEQELKQLETLKGRSKSDKLRRAIKIAYVQGETEKKAQPFKN